MVGQRVLRRWLSYGPKKSLILTLAIPYCYITANRDGRDSHLQEVPRLYVTLETKLSDISSSGTHPRGYTSSNLATTSWKHRDLERLDRYWRQGCKTAWKLNESTGNQSWTTQKYMGGMGYTTTMTVLTHTLHTHVDMCMKTEDLACQIMKNDQSRAMRE